MAKKKTPVAALAAQWVLHNIAYVAFLALLITAYIANTHLAERTARDIKKQQEQVERLRWRYVSLKTELMFGSKQSEVARRVEDMGLRPGIRNTKKIVVDAERLEQLDQMPKLRPQAQPDRSVASLQ